MNADEIEMVIQGLQKDAYTLLKDHVTLTREVKLLTKWFRKQDTETGSGNTKSMLTGSTMLTVSRALRKSGTTQCRLLNSVMYCEISITLASKNRISTITRALCLVPRK